MSEFAAYSSINDCAEIIFNVKRGDDNSVFDNYYMGGGGILLSCSFKECKFEHCVFFFLLPFADINISKCEIKEKMGV